VSDAPHPTELLVCTTCRMGQEIGPDGVRPGARLHAELTSMDWPEGVQLRPVECLSNCESGCSVVLRGGARRWTYVYGRLTPEMAATVHAGATLYHDTDNGLVPWRSRPEHFRKNCIARIPPLETPE
jgi:predicted metal-binding protein|tara:strand:- start:1499 stop:1879 length:381 start_codon:yes stop_codon:yes gene_type:complete